MHCLLPGSSGALPSGGNSPSNCLSRKGYLLLGWDRATRFPCCFCPHDHPCFVCSLSASADIHKASTESGGVLLRLCPRHTAPARWALVEGRPSLLSDLLEAPVQGQQLNRAGTGRGHSKPLNWLLVSSPVLCPVVFRCENPSILPPFGSLMLADGNPAQLSKTLNNLLRTKLLGLRAGSFSLFLLCSLQTAFQRRSF